MGEEVYYNISKKYETWNKYSKPDVLNKKGVLNPKRLGRGSQFDPPPVVFRKIYLLKKEWSTGFLWLLIFFSEILFWKSHLFWNFHCNSQVVQKIWRISLQYYLFSSIFKNFWIFWHFLVTKKLMTSAYSSSCQHFFALKAL